MGDGFDAGCEDVGLTRANSVACLMIDGDKGVFGFCGFGEFRGDGDFEIVRLGECRGVGDFEIVGFSEFCGVNGLESSFFSECFRVGGLDVAGDARFGDGSFGSVSGTDDGSNPEILCETSKEAASEGGGIEGTEGDSSETEPHDDEPQDLALSLP